jgi:hypothetical protein
MNRLIILILGFLLPLIQVSFGQNIKTLDMDGKLKTTEQVFSDVKTIIPAGQKVIIISGPVKGVYFVDYNGLKGYLNEVYFSPASKRSSYTTPSTSSSYSYPQKWNEYNLKEHWKINGMDLVLLF